MNNEYLRQQLENLLKQHDWYYAWSDDSRVFKAGNAVQNQINSLIDQLGQEGKDLYNKYVPSDMKQLSEKKLTKPEKKEKEKIVKGLKGQKKDFAKRYGTKDAEAVMYATATKLAKKIKESDKQKVEEAVVKYFEAKKAKPDFLDLDKDGNKKESMKKAAKDAKKKGTKIEEEAMLFTNDFAKQDQVNYIDDEGRMAKQQLFKIKKYAQELCDMLDDNTQLEGWVQAKITKAEEAIGAVKHYMEYEMFRKQQG
jgi:hypothetical protein